MKYDKEEKSIVDAYEKGTIKLSRPSKKEIEAIKATANKTLVKGQKNHYTSLRPRLSGHSKEGHRNGYPLSDTNFRYYTSLYRRGFDVKDRITTGCSQLLTVVADPIVGHKSMNTTDIRGARRIRNGLVTVSAGLCMIGLLARFYPKADTLITVCLRGGLPLGCRPVAGTDDGKGRPRIVVANVEAVP